MYSYYVTHTRLTEYEGTVTPTILGVYRLTAWNTPEALATARSSILLGPTYETLTISKTAPIGYQGQIETLGEQ